MGKNIFEILKETGEMEDEIFNNIYPEKIKSLAKRHWTPFMVARLAAEYLAEKAGTKVLDIGSGVGKFCLIGANFTEGVFTGIEQRKGLVKLANKIAANNGIKNVEFIQANIMEIDFINYQSFYLFNPFHENLEPSAKIDTTVKLNAKLYKIYTDYVYEQLEETPKGTRLATYYIPNHQVSPLFELEQSTVEGKLNFWRKRG